MEHKYVRENINVENASIGWRNFKGVAGKFNKEGDRHFTLFLDEEIANKLSDDGWNIGFLEPREPGDQRTGKLMVKVSFKNIPPKVVLISGSAPQQLLDEERVGLLDNIEIANVDAIVKPYNYILYEGTKNEKRGVSAYLKAIYVTMVVDEFEEKYR